jgi:hypothetical protein
VLRSPYAATVTGRADATMKAASRLTGEAAMQRNKTDKLNYLSGS